MKITILRPLMKQTFNAMKPTINNIHILLKRCLDIGFTYDKITTYLSEQEKDLIDKMIIKYEFDTSLKYSKHISRSAERVRQIQMRVYRKLRRFIMNKFLIPFCKKEFGSFKDEVNIWNYFLEVEVIISKCITPNDIAENIFEELIVLSDNKLKNLSQITNHISLHI